MKYETKTVGNKHKKQQLDMIKVGDILVSKVNGQKIEVRGICGTIVFNRIVNEDNSVSMTSFDELEDLITIGNYNLNK